MPRYRIEIPYSKITLWGNPVYLKMRRGWEFRSRARFDSVEPKLLSTLLARPVLLDGCPRSLSNPTLSMQKIQLPDTFVPGALFLRRGWDSNPRSRYQDYSFQDCRFRPLSHLSMNEQLSTYYKTRFFTITFTSKKHLARITQFSSYKHNETLGRGV